MLLGGGVLLGVSWLNFSVSSVMLDFCLCSGSMFRVMVVCFSRC